jgi:hypothetical protein
MREMNGIVRLRVLDFNDAPFTKDRAEAERTYEGSLRKIDGGEPSFTEQLDDDATASDVEEALNALLEPVTLQEIADNQAGATLGVEVIDDEDDEDDANWVGDDDVSEAGMSVSQMLHLLDSMKGYIQTETSTIIDDNGSALPTVPQHCT